jgi:hypothetical protein
MTATATAPIVKLTAPHVMEIELEPQHKVVITKQAAGWQATFLAPTLTLVFTTECRWVQPTDAELATGDGITWADGQALTAAVTDTLQ